MTAIKLNGGLGLAVLAAAAVGVWMYAKRKQPATAQAAQRRPVRRPQTIDRTQTYANPQTMGELLARQVVQQTLGLWTRPPAAADAAVGTAAARDAIRRQEGEGYYGWTAPMVTPVNESITASYDSGGNPWGTNLVDGVMGGPVYDVGMDLGNYEFGGVVGGW